MYGNLQVAKFGAYSNPVKWELSIFFTYFIIASRGQGLFSGKTIFPSQTQKPNFSLQFMLYNESLIRGGPFMQVKGSLNELDFVPISPYNKIIVKLP